MSYLSFRVRSYRSPSFRYSPVRHLSFRQLSTTIALCVCTVCAPLVRADATADARKAIQAIYDKENAAAAKKDINGAFASRTADYQATDAQGGKISLAQARESSVQVFKAANSIKASTTIQKLTLSGNQAIVTAKDHTDLMLVTAKGAKPAHVTVDSTEEDTWVKKGNTWLCKSTKLVTQAMTKDGKPFQGL